MACAVLARYGELPFNDVIILSSAGILRIVCARPRLPCRRYFAARM